MSSFLLCAAPFAGHVAPMLPLARELVSRQHDVRVLTGRRFSDTVEATGAAFVPLPIEADPTDPTKLPGRPERAGLPQAVFDLTEVFVGRLATQSRAIDNARADRPVDVVVTESMFFGVAPLLQRAQTGRPRVVVLGTNPLSLPGPGLAPAGLGLLPMPGPIGQLRNTALRGAVRLAMRTVQRRAAEQFRAAGVTRPTTFILDWIRLADAVIQLTVPGFEFPRQATSPPPVHFVGPIAVSEEGAVPEALLARDRSRPLVLVTQGSAATDPTQLIEPLLTAVDDGSVDVLLNLAGVDAPWLDRRRLPPYVTVAEHLPYDKVFPLIDAFVTNGGYGGLGFALRHGVPVVSVGSSEDKAEVAARVRWSGIGVGMATDRPRSDALRTAVHRVLHEPEFGTRARALQQQVAQAGGLTAAVHALESRAQPRD